MRRKIFLLIVVAFVFLNLFAVSAQDNETVIDDASVVNETAAPAVSVDVPSSYGAVSPYIEPIEVIHVDPIINPNWPPKFVEKNFNTTDLVKVYKNDSQFVVDARNTPYYQKIRFFVHVVMLSTSEVLKLSPFTVNVLPALEKAISPIARRVLASFLQTRMCS